MTGRTCGIVAGYDGSPAVTLGRRGSPGARYDAGDLPCLDALRRDAYRVSSCRSGRRHGEEILARGLPYVRSALGPGRVRPALVAGSAARVLCGRSRATEMVVVGCCGHSELPGLRLGSVSWQVAGHAAGRDGWRPVNEAPGPVVDGVDGSSAPQAALTFAFEKAAPRGVPLPRPGRPGGAAPFVLTGGNRLPA
jgi:hypothetical protein